MIKCVLILTNGDYVFDLTDEQRDAVISCFTSAKGKKQHFAFNFSSGPIVIDHNHLIGIIFKKNNPPTQ